MLAWWIHICFYLWLTFHLDGFHIRFTSVSTSVASTRLILGSYWLIAICNNNTYIFQHPYKGKGKRSIAVRKKPHRYGSKQNSGRRVVDRNKRFLWRPKNKEASETLWSITVNWNVHRSSNRRFYYILFLSRFWICVEISCISSVALSETAQCLPGVENSEHLSRPLSVSFHNSGVTTDASVFWPMPFRWDGVSLPVVACGERPAGHAGLGYLPASTWAGRRPCQQRAMIIARASIVSRDASHRWTERGTYSDKPYIRCQQRLTNTICWWKWPFGISQAVWWHR